MSALRVFVALAMLGVLSATPGVAAPAAPVQSTAFVRTLRYQSAADAVLMLRWVLTPVGTAEARGHDVVVHDSPSRLQKVKDLLDDFDHPRIPLRVVVQLVQASSLAVSPQAASNIPEPLLGRLRKSFRYETYHLLAQVGFEAKEGTDVSSHLGEGFSMAFHLGTVRLGQSVNLQTFTMKDDDATASVLLDTSLVLALDHPLAMGLTTDESSDSALLVVLTCSRVAPEP